MPSESNSIETVLSVVPTVVMLAGCGLAALVGIRSWCSVRNRDRLVWTDPSSLTVRPDPNRVVTSLSATIGAIIAALLLLYLAWPASSPNGSPRLMFVQAGIGGLLCSIALFGLLSRQFVAIVADVAQGLMLLGLCCVLLILPSPEGGMVVRMPGYLSILAVAGAIMAAVWCWLWGVWEQQLDGGRAWTAAGLMRQHLPRYALGASSFGVLAIVVMALWPRLSDSAHRDASFVRMVTGIAAHLLLLLVASACGRRIGRGAFYGLAVVVAISLVGFVMLRAADFVTIIRG